MAQADPLSLTVNAVAKSLARLGNDDSGSRYRADDGVSVFDLAFQHSSTNSGRLRHLIKLDQTNIATDVYNPATYTRYKQSVHIVADTPPSGFNAASQLNLWLALKDLMSASTNAVAIKFLNGEA